MTTKDIFTKNTKSILPLTEHDLEPITVIDNDSMLIFSGPHNGHAVPSCLPPCLGTDPKWFSTAHEAVDLHMDKLFIALQDSMAAASYVYGNYSRLVCDLNAVPKHAITQSSSEFDDIKIPDNHPDQCCDNQHTSRLNALYHPYHDAKKNMIDQARTSHGGALVLDMHSFTPTWVQKHREVEIGTIRCENTPLSCALEEYLKSSSEFHFVSGEPYRVAEHPTNAASLITKNNDLQYIGIEIRNDLISTPEGIEKMSAFIKGCVDHLYAHPDFERITSARSLTLGIEDNELTAQ